ncbi:MAG TPA: Gfo/Idh/MocA family oxidoreductase [Acidobacteriaceae bacterium]
MPPLRIAVAGAGAFGRNHLRVYRELEAAAPDAVALVAAVDANPATRADIAARYTIPAFASVDELLSSSIALDAASICVPTILHAAVAEQLLRAGIDVLIEKPFAATLAEADTILALAAEKRRIVQIGHLERFNPAVTAVQPLLNRPMFFEAHRLSIFTPRSLDVDVVLDLMIHDLDIVLQLANSPVRELRAVGLPVLSRKVDIANARVEFDSGGIANFTASRVSTEQVRKLRFFQPRQYLSLDFARQELLTIEVSAAAAAAASMGGAALEALARAAAATPATHPSAGLNLQKFTVEKSEPLRLELENFLTAVQTRTAPRVTGSQGRAALALALDINAAIAAHAHRAGLT